MPQIMLVHISEQVIFENPTQKPDYWFIRICSDLFKTAGTWHYLALSFSLIAPQPIVSSAASRPAVRTSGSQSVVLSNPSSSKAKWQPSYH